MFLWALTMFALMSYQKASTMIKQLLYVMPKMWILYRWTGLTIENS